MATSAAEIIRNVITTAVHDSEVRTTAKLDEIATRILTWLTESEKRTTASLSESHAATLASLKAVISQIDMLQRVVTTAAPVAPAKAAAKSVTKSAPKAAKPKVTKTDTSPLAGAKRNVRIFINYITSNNTDPMYEKWTKEFVIPHMTALKALPSYEETMNKATDAQGRLRALGRLLWDNIIRGSDNEARAREFHIKWKAANSDVETPTILGADTATPVAASVPVLPGIDDPRTAVSEAAGEGEGEGEGDEAPVEDDFEAEIRKMTGK